MDSLNNDMRHLSIEDTDTDTLVDIVDDDDDADFYECLQDIINWDTEYEQASRKRKSDLQGRENSSYFDTLEKDNCMKRTKKAYGKTLLQSKNVTFCSYYGDPCHMRETSDHMKLHPYIYSKKWRNVKTTRGKPSSSCITCRALQKECDSAPGYGRCSNCKIAGENMVCVFDTKWYPWLKQNPRHAYYNNVWRSDVTNADKFHV